LGAFETLFEFVFDAESGAYLGGAWPSSGLVQSTIGTAAGDFFGVTYGGLHNLGTIFRMTPEGDLTTLVHFTGSGGDAKGLNPGGNLVEGPDGNVYGTTEGGTYWDQNLQREITHFGTVFKVTPSGDFSTLVEFSGTGGPSKGAFPDGGLYLASDGNFYGSTDLGGEHNLGTIFRMTPTGTLTTLVEFTGMNGPVLGSYPATPIQHPDGFFYGTTGLGGADNFGTLYRMNSQGSLTTLIEITEPNDASRGNFPVAPLMRSQDGYFYGTTLSGGFQEGGSIFRLSPGGSLTHLADFDGSAGWAPDSALVEGESGHFYGTTTEGGAYANGTVFQMEPDGSVNLLSEFPNDAESGNPLYGIYPNGLTKGPDDNFYGTTSYGGEHGNGTFYRITPDGQITIIRSLDENGLSFSSESTLVYFDGFFYGTGGGGEGYGTVFKISPSGVLTTLVEFTGGEGTHRGASPNGLVIGSDGNFYGTTRYGGAFWSGTAYQITPSGLLTVLADFDETGGFYPIGNLAEAGDGFFYGTTSEGGLDQRGTIFRISSTGDLETVVEFNGTNGANPRSGLIPDGEGNLYGTTSQGGAGDRGTIYRLLFPGAPMLSALTPVLRGDSVALPARVNARGHTASVVFEYGSERTNLSHFIPLLYNLEDFENRLVIASLSSLPPGTTYFYRFRASNSHGETVTPVQSFTTLAPPLVSAAPADEILPTSARLQGTVDARNHETTVRFEWGTDGNSFPNSLVADPGLVMGSGATEVSAPLAGLTKGTTYFYRVVATNEGGTTVSGTQSFRTLTDPTVTIGGSFALSTTSVRVEGAVDPEGSDSNVVFEYSDDGWDSFEIKPAAQGTQSGSGSRPVSAVLTNLQQGVTYHYRLRATSDGGSGVSSTNSFSMNVLSGFDRSHPGPPPVSEGFLTVNLFPANLAHGWRFVGEQEWRASGVPATGLVSGRYEVEFRPIPGYITPPPLVDEDLNGDGIKENAAAIEVVSGATPAVRNEHYFETGSIQTGTLTVNLKPESITSGDNRARWRLLGEGDTAWRDSGAPLSGLPAGTYLVECLPVPGRATPPHTNVRVVARQNASPTITYFLPDGATGEVPSVLAFEAISAAGIAAYPYVGQIRGSAGSGTGFVVKKRVVATAAHVVWNDGTLSPAEGLQWLHQRHRGLHEPRPLQPRGFYLFDGYAAQRQADASPGDSSPQSQHLDVAALYFNENAARGGFGGFLASDLAENEFLLSDADKMLVGYPLDGVAAASRGRMHATAPFNVEFGPAFGRTFTTSQIRSFGGNSGGPLCVQFEGGAFLPAAVYLGGNSQTVVRAIDSEVVELFNRAEISGNGGSNNTGGGITHTSVDPLPGEGGRGGLRVVLQPAAVLAKGARWRLKPETAFRNSGDQKGELAPGSYRLEFASVAGYQAPPLLQVQVRANQLTTLTFTYALPPVLGPEISVRGRGRDLPDGDASPSALDGTDFGVVAVDPVPAVPPDPPAPDPTSTRTFAVFNTGNRALSLGTPAFSGDHAADFEVTTPPAPSVPPGGSTSFTVRFDPSAPGVRTASLSLPNNDTNENPFNFALQGNHVADSNSNGFSDVEEAALNALLATFTVGQRVDLDLSFLRLGSGHTLALTGLPPGLVFNPATKRLTGTILGKPAPGHLLRKMDGATELGSRAFDLRVFFPARLVVSTAPRRFAPTLVNRRSAAQFVRLTNSGELPLQRLAVRLGGTAPNDFLLPVRPPGTLNPGASATVSVVFRPLRKGTRLGSLILTSSDAPRSVPLSGFGQ